jgi:HlyD family secretion protein
MNKDNLTNDQKAMMMRQLQSMMGAGQQPEPSDENKNSKTTITGKIKHFILQIPSRVVALCNGSVHYIDVGIRFVTKPQDADRNEVANAARAPILFGCFVLVFFVAGGLIWSGTAPLDSAAGAIGTVIASSKKKTVHTYEGGEVEKILVKQGDYVKAHQPLVFLNDTRAKVGFDNALSSYRLYLATENRLSAERDNLDEIKFSDFLMQDHNVDEVAKLLNTQENILKSKRELFHSTLNSYQNKIEQYEKRIQAMLAKKESLDKSYAVAKERLVSAQSLLKQGFTNKAQVQEMEAREVEIKSLISSNDVDLINAQQEISNVNLQIISFKSEYLHKILAELKEEETKVFQSFNQYLGAKDLLEKTVIRSPVDGIVNDLKVYFDKALVGNGAEIAEITPIKDALVIEAKIPPQNINSVTIGLKAKIRFSAFKSRTTPVFTGTVTSLSSDVLRDPQPMDPRTAVYYAARIEIDMDQFNKAAKKLNLELYPGMQAEVQIVTGERTLLKYLLEPITDNMFKAFKEK